jgi:hypothetical protein
MPAKAAGAAPGIHDFLVTTRPSDMRQSVDPSASTTQYLFIDFWTIYSTTGDYVLETACHFQSSHFHFAQFHFNFLYY